MKLTDTTHRWLGRAPGRRLEERARWERREIGSNRRGPEDVVCVAKGGNGRLADRGRDWDDGLGRQWWVSFFLFFAVIV